MNFHGERLIHPARSPLHQIKSRIIQRPYQNPVLNPPNPERRHGEHNIMNQPNWRPRKRKSKKGPRLKQLKDPTTPTTRKITQCFTQTTRKQHRPPTRKFQTHPTALTEKIKSLQTTLTGFKITPSEGRKGDVFRLKKTTTHILIHVCEPQQPPNRKLQTKIQATHIHHQLLQP